MTCKQTQLDRIVKLLKRGWLSPAEAFTHGCGMKLSSRISDLKARGIAVKDKWSKDRSYKLYTLR